MTEKQPRYYQTIINWREIDTVLLDMDGTLLDLHFDNFVWNEIVPNAYAEQINAQKGHALATIRDHMNQIKGSMAFYSFDYWQSYTGLNIADLHHQHRDRIRFRPGALAFLNTMRRLGKKVVIATNADRRCFDIKDRALGLQALVDSVISSHDFNAPKEQQEFWRSLQLVCPFDPRRTVFYDDTVRVLDAAAEYGIAESWAVTTPDSQSPIRDPSVYPCFDHFNETYPDLL